MAAKSITFAIVRVLTTSAGNEMIELSFHSFKENRVGPLSLARDGDLRAFDVSYVLNGGMKADIARGRRWGH